MKSSPQPSPDQPLTGEVCSVCGTRLAGNRLQAQCPRCLLSLASTLGMPEETALKPGLLDLHQVRQFGDYELLEEIARGGMGVIYRAHQISLDREVAIKMILAGELAGSTALSMFQIEAHAAANLHHPNIVPVYEIGEHETQHYFTMRFVPGGKTIADWAAEHWGAFREIATATAQVAQAVAYAHTRSVLHRDLKPSNILWDAQAGPQVTDFGLAKLVDQVDPKFTRPVQAIGSPSYMAPEQVNGRSAEITTATDVYGLGAVLYELLSGRPPFAGDSAIETMRRAVEDNPAPLSNVPKDLSTICLKCLEKEPAHRYASAMAVAEDLERFARGEPVSVVPLTLPQTLWRWARRQPRTAALIGLCLFSLFAGLGGVTWQWRKTEFARDDQAKTLEHLRWQEIGRWLDDGETSRALAYLARLIRERPDRWQATMYSMSIVDQLSFPILVGPEIRPTIKLKGHAQLAPDGSWLAAAGEDSAVHVWVTASGKETATLAQPSPITALAVGPEPISLAVAGEDGSLQVYAKGSAAASRVRRTTGEPIQALKISADGSHLLARSREHLEIWPVAALDQPPAIFTLPESILGAELSEDGTRLLAWSGQHAVVWDTRSSQALLHAQPTQRFRRGVISATGQRAAFIDSSFAARVWEVDSGQPLRSIESPLSPVSQLAFDQNGTRLTLAGTSNDLTVFDVDSATPISPPMRHRYQIDALETSADGSRAFSFGRDEAVKVWDARTGRPVMNAIQGEGTAHSIASLDPSHDGRVVLVHIPSGNGERDSLAVWRGTHQQEAIRRVFAGQRDFDASQITPDGRLALVGLFPGNRSCVYETASGRVLWDKTVAGPVYLHLVSPDSRRYYALTANGWLYGWSLETGQSLWEPNHQPGLIRPAAISPDGTRIVAGHNDGHIRIYDTATGQVVQTLDHPGEIKAIRFAPDGSGRFISGSTDGLAHLWDLGTGRKLQTFTGHENAIISIAWSPDSQLVATASFDNTARVWNVQTGQPICPPLQHFAWLSHLEFSPDGTLLATACRDGSARLWHPRTGQPASPPLPQASTCEAVRFTSDGAAFLVRNHDGFRFWDTATAEPVTLHYPEPQTSGLGMDAESYRAMMTPDGTRVFLGKSMNYGALWTVPQPRSPAPAWFPDFLEMLAQVRLDEQGELRLVSRERLTGIATLLRGAPSGDGYADWARRILGTPAE